MRWLHDSILTALCLAGTSAFGQSVTYSCDGGFAPVLGGNNRVEGQVEAWTTFDDGTGPVLFAGGSLRWVNGETGTPLARWDGSEWDAVPGIVGTVAAMIVFDDGSGPALFVGGQIGLPGQPNQGVFRWDGTSFAPVGGVFAGDVTSFEIYDDGTGPALYAAGLFPEVGGISINNVARWDGTSGRRLGSGTNNRIETLEVFDGGQGAELYAGGKFLIAGAQPASRIARWNGTDWQPVAGGIDTGFNSNVQTLQTFDSGAGERLFVGGRFGFADGQQASGFARWDGASWTAYNFGFAHTIQELDVYDAGSGPRLYAAGRIRINGSWVGAARWSGALWVNLVGAPLSFGHSLGAHDDGTGAVLHVGPTAGSPNPLSSTTWNGSNWSNPVSSGPDGPIDALYRYESGGGSTLIVAGEFGSIGGVRAAGIAEWDGTQVMGLGSGFDGAPTAEDRVRAITSFDDGTGRALYVGGRFSDAGGVPADSLARWNGQVWSSLGGAAFGGMAYNGEVNALLEFDDGSGNALFVAGDFQSVAGIPTGSVARWDGANWSAIGNMPTLLSPTSRTQALCVFDDGNGPALYAGGFYSASNGSGALDVLRWTGTTWLPVIGGGPSFDGQVDALATFDDGTGEALYALGSFNNSMLGSPNIVRFNGTDWEPVGQGLQSVSLGAAHVFDDGSGPALYVAGRGLRVHGGDSALGARWNGLGWDPMLVQPSPGPSRSTNVFESFDIAGEPRLLLGGSATVTPSGDSFLTSWRGCSPGNDFCFADSEIVPNCAPCPCGNNNFPRRRSGCVHSAGDGARLRSSGSAEVLTGDLRFEVQAAVPNSIGLLISGTAALPANGSCFVGAGIPTPAFDGLRCVGQGILRHGTRPMAADGSVGSATPGWGPPDDPPGGIASFFGFVVGQERFFQVIYRDDPAAQCGTGLNTTNGVRLVFRS